MRVRISGGEGPGHRGEICKIGFILALFELLWLELQLVKMATAPSNKVAAVSSYRCGVALLHFPLWSAMEAGRGGVGHAQLIPHR
jgi:hypothetical protein